MFMPYFSLVGIHLLITSFKASGFRGIAQKKMQILANTQTCVYCLKVGHRQAIGNITPSSTTRILGYFLLSEIRAFTNTKNRHLRKR